MDNQKLVGRVWYCNMLESYTIVQRSLIYPRHITVSPRSPVSFAPLPWAIES